jgi:hypothetical protein
LGLNGTTKVVPLQNFDTIFPLLFGVPAWLGIYLRCRTLRLDLPLC